MNMKSALLAGASAHALGTVPDMDAPFYMGHFEMACLLAGVGYGSLPHAPFASTLEPGLIEGVEASYRYEIPSP